MSHILRISRKKDFQKSLPIIIEQKWDHWLSQIQYGGFVRNRHFFLHMECPWSPLSAYGWPFSSPETRVGKKKAILEYPGQSLIWISALLNTLSLQSLLFLEGNGKAILFHDVMKVKWDDFRENVFSLEIIALWQLDS